MQGSLDEIQIQILRLALTRKIPKIIISGKRRNVSIQEHLTFSLNQSARFPTFILDEIKTLIFLDCEKSENSYYYSKGKKSWQLKILKINNL